MTEAQMQAARSQQRREMVSLIGRVAKMSEDSARQMEQLLYSQTSMSEYGELLDEKALKEKLREMVRRRQMEKKRKSDEQTASGGKDTASPSLTSSLSLPMPQTQAFSSSSSTTSAISPTQPLSLFPFLPGPPNSGTPKPVAKADALADLADLELAVLDILDASHRTAEHISVSPHTSEESLRASEELLRHLGGRVVGGVRRLQTELSRLSVGLDCDVPLGGGDYGDAFLALIQEKGQEGRNDV